MLSKYVAVPGIFLFNGVGIWYNISDFCRYELQDCIIKNVIGLTRNTDISWINHYRVKIRVKNDYEEETHWIKNGLYSEYTPQVLQYLINKYSKPYSLNQQSISSFETLEDDILIINVIFKEENNNIQTGIVWDNKDWAINLYFL